LTYKFGFWESSLALGAVFGIVRQDLHSPINLLSYS